MIKPNALDWREWADRHPLKATKIPAQDNYALDKPEVIHLEREGLEPSVQFTLAELEAVLAPYRHLERYRITEMQLCVCGTRRFQVEDTHEGDVSFAHVGNLNPHDAGHRAVRALLNREREANR